MAKVTRQNLSTNTDGAGGWIEVDVCKDNNGDYGAIQTFQNDRFMSYFIGDHNLKDIDDIIEGLQALKERLEKAYKEKEEQ